MPKMQLGAALCCLWIAGAVAPADAATDPNRIAAMLAAAAAATGDVEITYDKVTGAGDTITLSNVKVTSTGAITGNTAAGAAAVPGTPPAATAPGAKPAAGAPPAPAANAKPGTATPAPATGTAAATAAKPGTTPPPVPAANAKPGTATPAPATGTAAATAAKPGTATPAPATGTAAANAAKPGTTPAPTATTAANAAKPGTTPTPAAGATTATAAKPGAATTATTTATSGEGTHTTMTFPAVVITGAVERPMGGFTATHIAFDAGTAVAAAGTTKWATGSVDDVIVPSAAEIMAHAKIRPFGAATLGNLSLTKGTSSAAPVTVASVNVTVGPVSDTTPAQVHLTATGAKLPVSLISNPVGVAMISRMGYTEFDANVSMDAAYDTAANSIAISSLLIDAAQVGKLSLAVHLSDTSLGGIADPTQASGARSAARLDSATIRFDDGGFVGRMLNMQAELAGGSKSDVIDGLVYGALPFVLNYVSNTDFRMQFQAAAATFLANPKNIIITATPAMPVPLGEVVRAAVADPLKLPDLLTPQVAANK